MQGSNTSRSDVRRSPFRAVLSAFGLALLGTAAHAAGDSGYQAIANVHVEAGYFVTIGASVAFNNPDGCGNSTVAMLQATSSGYMEIYAQVLTAQASGRQIDFYFSGCATTPWGYTAPIVYSSTVSN